MDMRGHGDSSWMSEYSAATQVQDVVRLLDAVGTLSCILVGMSMGAAVATKTAVLHPDRVVALVVVDPSYCASSCIACLPASGWSD